jgi:hypothetical protein
MIIGIDEVGNFDPNSDTYNYFVAVLIDQNKDKYKIKNTAHPQENDGGWAVLEMWHILL